MKFWPTLHRCFRALVNFNTKIKQAKFERVRVMRGTFTGVMPIATIVISHVAIVFISNQLRLDS